MARATWLSTGSRMPWTHRAVRRTHHLRLESERGIPMIASVRPLLSCLLLLSFHVCLLRFSCYVFLFNIYSKSKGCLVSNTKYKIPTTLKAQKTMEYKIPIFLRLCLVSFKIQNLLFSRGPLETLLCFFFCLLKPKSKMKNNYLFTKNFTQCLVLFYGIID